MDAIMGLLFARVSFKKWMAWFVALCVLGQIIKYAIGAPGGRLW
jgi:biotin transporter BioY